MRHLNPDMYKIINKLWKQEIGIQNLFKLRFVLIYFIAYLEEYLVLCEKKFQQLEQYDKGSDQSIFQGQYQKALEGFVTMTSDSDANRAIKNKSKLGEEKGKMPKKDRF